MKKDLPPPGNMDLIKERERNRVLRAAVRRLFRTLNMSTVAGISNEAMLDFLQARNALFNIVFPENEDE